MQKIVPDEIMTEIITNGKRKLKREAISLCESFLLGVCGVDRN